VYIDGAGLRRTVQSLVARAGANTRLANAVKNGADLIERGRCEIVDAETIRVYSPSKEIYLTSITDCVNERTGEQCPAFKVGVPCKHRQALHILMALNGEDEGGQQVCRGCGGRFHADRLRPVDARQLRAGDVVPSGACPICGNYCYPSEDAGKGGH
jgi:hypothetical protein